MTHTLEITTEELRELVLLLRAAKANVGGLDAYFVGEGTMETCRRAVSRAAGVDVGAPWEELRKKFKPE